jgi:hypothetical protein
LSGDEAARARMTAIEAALRAGATSPSAAADEIAALIGL